MTDATELTIQPGEVVPETCPAVVVDHGLTVDPSPAEDAPPKGRGGAPKGNLNRCAGNLDKQTAVLLARLSKAPARAKRDRARRRGEEEAAEIAKELNLDKHALGRRVCRRLVDTEQEIQHLAKVVAARGRFSTKGEPKSWYAQYLKLQSEDRAELRRLVDDLRALPAAKGAELFAGLLSITLDAVPAIGVDCRCSACGQIVGTPSESVQAPVPAVLSAGQADPPSEEPDPVRERVARPVGELLRIEPVEVVVTRHDPVPLRRGKRDFMTGEVLPAAPRDFNW